MAAPIRREVTAKISAQSTILCDSAFQNQHKRAEITITADSPLVSVCKLGSLNNAVIDKESLILLTDSCYVTFTLPIRR